VLTNTIRCWLTRTGQPESWLQPKLSTLSDHSLIIDRNIFISRIAKAIRLGQLCVIVGDYDVDGSGAAVILSDCIRQAGGRVSVVLCSRFDGGYGLSDNVVDRVLKLSPSVLISCDCGGSDAPRIERLNSHGIDCLILDHHVVPKEKLPSLAFINPHRADCPSTFKHYSSGALAWSVCAGLLSELGLRDSIDHRQWYDIMGLTLISDVMPLIFDNRALTRVGLASLSAAKRPGIRALLEIAKVQPDTALTSRDVSFKIIAGLNAPGRLGSQDIIVDLLLSKDIDEARRIASEVKFLWDKRRTLTDEMTVEVIKQIEDKGYYNDPSIVLGQDSFGHGIVGIVAARVVDKFGKPTAIIGHEGRGSLRGPSGSKLYTALAFCKEHLLRHGGHEAASGMQISWENLESFRQKFNEFFTLNPPVPPADQFDPVLELNLEDDLLKLCDDIFLLEPTGQGNPKPVIQTHGIIKSMKFVKGDHLKFDLLLPNNTLLPCFKIVADENKQLSTNQKITVQGDLRKNVWNGRTKAEMFVQTIII
jgi:single-stranded-DNA-specific exonuclease